MREMWTNLTQIKPAGPEINWWVVLFPKVFDNIEHKYCCPFETTKAEGFVIIHLSDVFVHVLTV